jgi:two-component system alkaline phosphatase synthesis response regulator PhoP
MKPVKILLVDDEPDILEFLGYNLRKEGYEVYTASNGRDGIVKARKIREKLNTQSIKTIKGVGYKFES